MSNITVCDRVYHLKSYADCFLATDAISFVESHWRVATQTAIEVLDDVIKQGLIQHVTGEHSMEEDYLFFRFVGDAAKGRLRVFSAHNAAHARTADGDVGACAVSPKRVTRTTQSWKNWFTPTRSSNSNSSSSFESDETTALHARSVSGTTASRSASGSASSRTGFAAQHESRDRLYVPKVLTILSTRPLFRAFSAFLSQLYQISLSTSPVPLERHVATFINHIPLPSKSTGWTQGGHGPLAQRHAHPRPYNIHLDLALIPLSSTGIPTRASTLPPIIIPPPPPHQTTLPPLDLSFLSLLRSLSVSSILKILPVLLREGRVLLLSSCGAMLAEVCEILRAILFPLQWQCCYVPRLPEALIGALETPGGYLIGVVTQDNGDNPMGGWEGGELEDIVRTQLAEGVCVVCVDADLVVMGEVKEEVLKEVCFLIEGGWKEREEVAERDPNYPSYLPTTPCCEPPSLASPPNPPPSSGRLATPSNGAISATSLSLGVFKDTGAQPPSRPLKKLENRLNAIRSDAMVALNVPSLPLSATDRSSYSCAFSFSLPPACVDDEDSTGSEDEFGDVGAYHTETQRNYDRQRRNSDRVCGAIRDAFVRFMCHPHILGSYAAYINNTSESDVAGINEHRDAVQEVGKVGNLAKMIISNAEGGTYSASPTNSSNSTPHTPQSPDSAFSDSAASPSMLSPNTSSNSSNQPEPAPMGFYQIFDEDSFIRCSPLHGKSLRRAMTRTQMFVELVEERYEINVRRLQRLPEDEPMEGFVGREAALFFERCCIECRKKAIAKKNPVEEALSTAFMYPGMGVTKEGKRRSNIPSSSSQSLMITESVGKSMRKKERSETLASGASDFAIKNPNNEGEVDGHLMKASKIVGGTGVGVLVGMVGGPIGGIIGGVLGSGIGAASVVSSVSADRKVKKKKKKKTNRKKTSGNSPPNLQRVQSLPKAQPTIITRAQLKEALNIERVESGGGGRVQPICVPGASSIGLGGYKMFEYATFPLLDEELLIIDSSAIPPILKKLQALATEDERAAREEAGGETSEKSVYKRRGSFVAIKSAEREALSAHMSVYSMYLLQLPSRISSRQNVMGQLRELLAALGLLQKLQNVGLQHSLSGGLTCMLDDERIWRSVLVCIGGIQSKFTAMINVCKSLPILILGGGGGEEKSDFMVQSKQRGKALKSLNEAVTATKRIAHALFKAMRQANVGCSQVTLAHYMKSASSEEWGAEGGTKKSSTGGVRLTMLNRGVSEGSEGGGVNSSVISLENVLGGGGTVGPAAVLHGVGMVDEESCLGGRMGGRMGIFKSVSMDKMVASGVEFVKQKACSGVLTDSLLVAAVVCANVDKGLQANEMEVYWNNRGGGGGSGGGSSRRSGSFGSPKRKGSESAEFLKVPPSTPTRGGKKEKEGKEDGLGSNEDGLEMLYNDTDGEKVVLGEEGNIAVQMMWNRKECACGCALLDEEIVQLWAGAEAMVLIKAVKERVGEEEGRGIRTGGMRRNSKSLVDVDGERRKGLLGNDFSMDNVAIPVECVSCGGSYKPMLYFETAYGVEMGRVEEACGSVAYLPIQVVEALWQGVSVLHGRRFSSCPSWLSVNKPQLYHNLAWWTARCPSIPAHIHSPLVSVAWRKEVARWKGRREVERGVGPALGRSGSGSVGSSGGGGWMTVEEIWGGEKGIKVERVGEVLLLLRGSGGEVLEEVVRILRGAVGDWDKRGGRDRAVYCVLLQLCAHYDIGWLSSMLSVEDDLSQVPQLEKSLGEIEGFREVVAGVDATAMRAVFGHLFR